MSSMRLHVMRLMRRGASTHVPENTRQLTADMIRKPPMVYAAALCKAFGRVSHPPLDSKRSARLVSVGVSHYAEKVRWAFDILAATDTHAFDYVEDAHCPALAAIYTTELDPQCSAVPVVQLVERSSPPTDGSPHTVQRCTVLKDSTLILKATSPFLYPIDPKRLARVDEWEMLLDSQLGPTVRLLAYEHYLAKEMRPTFLALATNGVSMVETALFSAFVYGGFIQPRMKKLMGCSQDALVLSERTIDDVFAKVSAALEGKEPGSAFIVGDTFTAADLTFAALASPLLQIPQFASLQPASEELPSALRQLAARLRATPAGAHALHCYRHYRFATLDPSGRGIVPIESDARTITFRSGPRDNLAMLSSAAAAFIAAPAFAAYLAPKALASLTG